MEFGEKVRTLRRKKRMTQEDLAKAMNVQRNTVWRWENTRANPDKNTMILLAATLDTSIAYLMGETDNPDRMDFGQSPVFFQPSNVRAHSTISVPLIAGVVSASCSEGNAYADEVEWEEATTLSILRRYLDGYRWHEGKNSFLSMIVEGNSMEPRIHDGDILLFTRAPCDNGNFAIVKYDDRIIVRSVWDNHQGRIRLHAMNPAYEDIEVNIRGDSKEFAILGKVIRRICMESLSDGAI
ncbi:MAG: LexA family transcriptional regulator [Fretibacterium sp.]|nr:LexA family transcriptional regulator [Fretibacterium sp.]